jgi:hypothetical protein
MNFYKLFYWLTVGDKLATLFGWFSIVSCVAFLLTVLITYFAKPDIIVEYEKGEKSNDISTVKDAIWYRNVKIAHYFLFIITPISLFLWAGTPNKKEAVLIIGGGYVGNFITTDSSAKKLPSDIVYFLRTNLQLAAKESQVELQGLIEQPKVDTLATKTKEELLEIIKQSKK